MNSLHFQPPIPPPKIKICGITNPVDAYTAAQLGADFLGLNFFPGSKRYITPEMGQQIARVRSDFPDLRLVGVFVNSASAEIQRIADLVSLDILQLHGDESLEFCQSFSRPVWRALRVRGDDSLADLGKWQSLAGILLDAYSPKEFGGTGLSLDWNSLALGRKQIPYLVLAGGLTATNVAQAIAKLNPDVIDTASGVESDSDPRTKDPVKLRDFIMAVRQSRSGSAA